MRGPILQAIFPDFQEIFSRCFATNRLEKIKLATMGHFVTLPTAYEPLSMNASFYLTRFYTAISTQAARGFAMQLAYRSQARGYLRIMQKFRDRGAFHPRIIFKT
jgi:hypothetical protein